MNDLQLDFQLVFGLLVKSLFCLQNESRSYLVSQEPHEVVQLDYANRALLISTKFRSVIVFIEEDNRKVRVGQKDRKM